MKRSFLVLVLLLLVPTFSSAQVPGLTTPDVSPAASVSQTIGLTEMTVSYHRPAVNSRKVWAGWCPTTRSGARGGREHDRLVLHACDRQRDEARRRHLRAAMIPTTGNWTVIFSRESGAWGSFSYDQKEDGPHQREA